MKNWQSASKPTMDIFRPKGKRWRTASKKERVLLGRLDKLIGVPTGFHLCIYETSTREAGNAIMEKARKECKHLWTSRKQEG